MSDIIKYNEWIIIEEHIKYIDSLSNTINEGKIDINGVIKKTIEKCKNLSKKSVKKILRYTFMFLLAYTTLTNIVDIFKSNEVEQPVIEVVDEVVDDMGFKDPLQLEVSESGKNLIKEHEQLRLKAYSIGDGMITIGYGHAGRVKVSKYKIGDKITEEEANRLFEEDLREASDGVDRIFKQWKKDGKDIKVTQDMYNSLVSMTFNAGVGNIRKSDFIQHLKSGDYIKAGESIKTFATSKKFGGLEKRRKDEAKLFLSIF